MIVHVLTAVSRPENLPVLAASLARAAEEERTVDVVWRWRFDLERAHVGGQAVKNALIDRIDDGYVWILDDDTLVHPKLFAALADTYLNHPRVSALVVSQQRADGTVLRAAPENVRVAGIDAGQALLRRELIGNWRLPLNYEGDGHFLVALLANDPDVVFRDEILSFHNHLQRRPA